MSPSFFWPVLPSSLSLGLLLWVALLPPRLSLLVVIPSPPPFLLFPPSFVGGGAHAPLVLSALSPCGWCCLPSSVWVVLLPPHLPCWVVLLPLSSSFLWCFPHLSLWVGASFFCVVLLSSLGWRFLPIHLSSGVALPFWVALLLPLPLSLLGRAASPVKIHI